MKTSILLLAIPLVFSACKSQSTRVDWVDYGANPMQNAQYMSDMMAAGAPGPEHEMLVGRTGSWTVDGKMWMAPGEDAMPMAATATTESWLGGRYIVETFSSNFMGFPFEGRLLQGFDNVTQEYWSLWMDGMSTGSFYSRGTEVAPGLVEYHGSAVDLLTPKGRPTRMTVQDNGDGTHTMRMYDSRPGTEEFQVMELHYRRDS